MAADLGDGGVVAGSAIGGSGRAGSGVTSSGNSGAILSLSIPDFIGQLTQ